MCFNYRLFIWRILFHCLYCFPPKILKTAHDYYCHKVMIWSYWKKERLSFILVNMKYLLTDKQEIIFDNWSECLRLFWSGSVLRIQMHRTSRKKVHWESEIMHILGDLCTFWSISANFSWLNIELNRRERKRRLLDAKQKSEWRPKNWNDEIPHIKSNWLEIWNTMSTNIFEGVVIVFFGL